jgi:hypothetical protein
MSDEGISLITSFKKLGLNLLVKKFVGRSSWVWVSRGTLPRSKGELLEIWRIRVPGLVAKYMNYASVLLEADAKVFSGPQNIKVQDEPAHFKFSTSAFGSSELWGSAGRVVTHTKFSHHGVVALRYPSLIL